VWQQLQTERLSGMAAFAADLVGTGQVRDDVSADAARDLLWTMTSVAIYELLVLDRGWTLDRYRQFLADAILAALVRPPA
jgi:hypothetical protein